MKFNYALQMLEVELKRLRYDSTTWETEMMGTLVSPQKKIEELQAAILLLQQKANEDIQPQLQQANVIGSKNLKV